MTTITINTANNISNSKFDLGAVLEQLKAFFVPDTQPARKPVARAAKAPAARTWSAVSVECDSWMSFTRG